MSNAYPVEKSLEKPGDVKIHKRHSRLFYIVLVILLFVGFILFAVFVNTFRIKEGNISIPVALPIIALLILYEAVIRDRGLSALGVKKEKFLKNVGIGVVVAFLGFFVIYALFNLAIPGFIQEIGSREETISSSFMNSFAFPLNWIFQTIYAFAFIAPAEELLFRGFIQGKLHDRIGPYPAIGIQSILFGLAHGVPFFILGSPVALCAAYGLLGLSAGILTGMAYYKTGNNIVAPWIAHAIADTPIAMLLFG